ncbi:hypothetical protein D3C76_1070230 [compost metagenome]
MHESAKIIRNIRLRFLRSICTQGSDMRFIGVIHIEIGVPDPLHRSCAACRERIGVLAFENATKLFFRTFGSSIRGFHIHDARLLNEIWLMWRFGENAIPDQIIV